MHGALQRRPTRELRPRQEKQLHEEYTHNPEGGGGVYKGQGRWKMRRMKGKRGKKGKRYFFLMRIRLLLLFFCLYHPTDCADYRFRRRSERVHRTPQKLLKIRRQNCKGCGEESLGGVGKGSLLPRRLQLHRQNRRRRRLRRQRTMESLPLLRK